MAFGKAVLAEDASRGLLPARHHLSLTSPRPKHTSGSRGGSLPASPESRCQPVPWLLRDMTGKEPCHNILCVCLVTGLFSCE